MRRRRSPNFQTFYSKSKSSSLTGHPKSGRCILVNAILWILEITIVPFSSHFSERDRKSLLFLWSHISFPMEMPRAAIPIISLPSLRKAQILNDERRVKSSLRVSGPFHIWILHGYNNSRNVGGGRDTKYDFFFLKKTQQLAVNMDKYV